MITFNPKDRIIFPKLFKHVLFRDDAPKEKELSYKLFKPIFILVISDQIHLAQKFIEDYIDDLEPLGNKSMMPMK